MMQRTETLKLIISGDGKLLDQTLGQSERRVNTYKSKVRGYFSEISRGIGNSIKGLLTNPLAIFGGGAALMFAGKQIIDYDSKLNRLAIRSSLTAKEMMMLNEEIKNTALPTGQSRGDLLTGLGKFRDETGNLALGREILQDMAIASTATGVGMEGIADIAAQLNEKLGLGKEEIRESLNLLTAQGHIKGFSLEDLAVNGERLFAAASRFDMKGMGGLRSFSAFLSSAKESTGSPTRAVSAIEAILTTLGDKKHAFGFNFRDDKGNLKDIETIIKGIVKAAGGSQGKIDKLFGPRAGRALAEMAKEYRESKKFTTFDTFKNADQGNTNKLMDDFGRYTETSAYQLKQLAIIAENFSNTALSPIIKQLSGSLSEMTKDPAKLKAFTSNLNDIAEIFGGIAKALGFVIEKYLWFYNLNKKANIGGMIYQTTHPSAALKESQSDVDKFNAIPRTLRKDIVDRVNNGEKVNIPKEISSAIGGKPSPAISVNAPSVKNDISLSIQLHENGTTVVKTNDKNTTVAVNRGSF